MVGKLLKYDLKWIYKVVVVFYILSLLFSLISRFFSIFPNSFLSQTIGQFCAGVAVGMMINSIINGVIRSWVRFIRNIYKDESYLTHTLPIEKRKIFLSKVLAAIIVVLTSSIVTIFCLFICFYSKENLEALKGMLMFAADIYNTSVVGLLILVVGIFMMELIFMIIVGYAAIILGHKSNKNKMVSSLVIGVPLYLIPQGLILLILYFVALVNPNFMSLFTSASEINIEVIKLLFIISLVIYIIYNCGFYIFGKHELEKGVNVD